MDYQAIEAIIFLAEKLVCKGLKDTQKVIKDHTEKVLTSEQKERIARIEAVG